MCARVALGRFGGQRSVIRLQHFLVRTEDRARSVRGQGKRHPVSIVAWTAGQGWEFAAKGSNYWRSPRKAEPQTQGTATTPPTTGREAHGMEAMETSARGTLPSRGRWLPLVALATLAACTGLIGERHDMGGDPGSGVGPGSGPGSTTGPGSGAGGSGVTGGPGAGAGPHTPCTTKAPPDARVVRLNFGQMANTLRTQIGPDALKGVSLDSPHKREFQALFAEGDLINTQILQKSVSWIESAVGTLTDATQFTRVTGCAAPITDACASAFITSFAEKAYRRPLTTDETASLTKLYSDLKAGGSRPDETTRYTIQATFLAPQALYRTEFGKPGGLSDYEMASELSYFLTDAPPDAPLLAAAKASQLSTLDGAGAQVDRPLKP